MEGTKNFQDYIINWPNTLEEHITRLRLVFDQLCKQGLKINKNKCNFAKSQITSEGLKPDPSKMETVSNVPLPKCKQDLQRLSGMTNYLWKFLQNYSEVILLRQLLQKDIIWSFQTP